MFPSSSGPDISIYLGEKEREYVLEMNDFYRCEKILIKLSNQLLSISARILLGFYKEVQGIKIKSRYKNVKAQAYGSASALGLLVLKTVYTSVGLVY